MYKDQSRSTLSRPGINEFRSRDHDKRTTKSSYTPKPERPATPRLLGHDKDLKRLEKEGRDIVITLLNDPMPRHGTVVSSDKYTIKIITNAGDRLTFFKHAIASFKEI